MVCGCRLQHRKRRGNMARDNGSKLRISTTRKTTAGNDLLWFIFPHLYLTISATPLVTVHLRVPNSFFTLYCGLMNSLTGCSPKFAM